MPEIKVTIPYKIGDKVWALVYDKSNNKIPMKVEIYGYYIDMIENITQDIIYRVKYKLWKEEAETTKRKKDIYVSKDELLKQEAKRFIQAYDWNIIWAKKDIKYFMKKLHRYEKLKAKYTRQLKKYTK